MMSEHLHPALAAAANSGLLPMTGIVTAALSGGADSVALLLILQKLQQTFGYTLRAVHVHHGIRGEEADRDARFCEQLCRQYRIPFQLCRVDARGFARKNKLSLETAARQLRYEALELAAPEGWIATAHHADDQAETLLFHLVRGTGLKGLCGIPQKRDRIIRPLLKLSKAQLCAFLEEEQQKYVTDSTNLTDDTCRNLLRHQVLPKLAAINPAVVKHMSQTTQSLSVDEEYLSEKASEAYAACLCESGGCKGLSEYHPALRMRCYRRCLLPYGIDPSYEILSHLDTLVLENKGKFTIAGDVYAQVHRGILYIRKNTAPLCSELPLQIGINQMFASRICHASILEAPISPGYHNTLTRSTLDYDKIIGNPHFRLWRNTDRITLPGRGFSSTLKKCVQTIVPIPERRTLYALFDDLGCIYCEQIGIAARVKPDAETNRLLVLQCSAAADETLKKE